MLDTQSSRVVRLSPCYSADGVLRERTFYSGEGTVRLWSSSRPPVPVPAGGPLVAFVVCHPSTGTMRLVVNRCSVAVIHHFFYIFLLRAPEPLRSLKAFARVYPCQSTVHYLPVRCILFFVFYATPTRDQPRWFRTLFSPVRCFTQCEPVGRCNLYCRFVAPFLPPPVIRCATTLRHPNYVQARTPIYSFRVV